jgi:hypothetical protein
MRTKTECSPVMPSTKKSKAWVLDSRELKNEHNNCQGKMMENWLCLEKGIIEFRMVRIVIVRSARRKPSSRRC